MLWTRAPVARASVQLLVTLTLTQIPVDPFAVFAFFVPLEDDRCVNQATIPFLERVLASSDASGEPRASNPFRSELAW